VYFSVQQEILVFVVEENGSFQAAIVS